MLGNPAPVKGKGALIDRRSLSISASRIVRSLPEGLAWLRRAKDRPRRSCSVDVTFQAKILEVSAKGGMAHGDLPLLHPDHKQKRGEVCRCSSILPVGDDPA